MFKLINLLQKPALRQGTPYLYQCKYLSTIVPQTPSTDDSKKDFRVLEKEDLVFGEKEDESSNLESDIPQLCATPKKKLSVFRRRNRRTWYYKKAEEVITRCSFCGFLSRPGHIMTGLGDNEGCTGQCTSPNPRVYSLEYKPPC